jgi:hypothetical protein
MCVLLLGPGADPPPSPPAAKADNKAEADEARAIAKMLAGEYVFQLDKTSKVKLRQEPEPVMRWQLTLDRRFYSDTYVWTHEGRPEVIVSITQVHGPRRAMETEIHSLSTGLPLLSHNGKVIWEPERAGVELKPISDAPKPGETAAVRLAQMRKLAAQYSVVADYGGMKKEDMRLLAAPVYRYASEKQGVTDGALFAFVRATDPEAFLMIEARKTRDGVEWQYAFARYNPCGLRATRDDREVWKVDPLSVKVNTDPKQPYCGLRKYSDFPVVK